jgi:hippurate hydrolase
MLNKTVLFLALFLLPNLLLQAQAVQQVRQLAHADSARLVAIFKDLHQNPELAFQEVRTAGIVANELKTLGYQVITGIARTGVAGILQNGPGPVVMFRADMDCNAVKETTGLPYASSKTMTNAAGMEVPVMHACGHDAHVTWLLGIAKLMVSLRKSWKGTLVLIAQPAEEIGAGANAMVADKMYEKGVPVPDYLFGMHTRPIAVGSIENGIGDRMAGTDQLDVTFHGIGGHGASPEFTKDPIVMASSAVMQYQTIISRNIGAQDVAVLTVGSFQAGNSNNVIPPSAVLKLNLRWFDEKTRNTLLEGIRRINEGIALANGLPKDLYPTLTMKAMAYPLVNHPVLTSKVNAALAQVLEKKNILTQVPALMISEDFHHLVLGNQKTVYDFVFVGTANPAAVAKARQEGKDYPFYNHNSNYEVDTAAIPLGVVVGTTALLEIFKR